MTYWLVKMVTIFLDSYSKTEMTFLMEEKEVIKCMPTMVMMKLDLEVDKMR